MGTLKRLARAIQWARVSIAGFVLSRGWGGFDMSLVLGILVLVLVFSGFQRKGMVWGRHVPIAMEVPASSLSVAFLRHLSRWEIYQNAFFR